MRQPGHRFFFDPAEIEPLPADHEQPQPQGTNVRVLIAGIGNIFLGDDGFGVEVAQRLARCELPPEVRVMDFGIRGLDLVYALQDGYDTTILIDAVPHGKAPGAVSIVEPNLNDLEAGPDHAKFVEPHGMNPMNVLRMAKAMSAPLEHILLIGCEPAYLGGDDGHMGLSEPVETAVIEAMKIVQNLVEQILDGGLPAPKGLERVNGEGTTPCA
jgi:hydrogenase maturation protease